MMMRRTAVRLARFEVLKAVVLKIQLLWDVAQPHFVNMYFVLCG